MRGALIAVLTTLALTAPAAIGQTTTVSADSRVRVSLKDGRRVTGTLSEMRGDTLVIISDGRLFRPTWKVAAGQAGRVEVSRGKYRSSGRILAGTLAGAGGGILAALTIDGLVDDGCSGDVCSGPSVTGPMLIGAAAGGVLAALVRVDRWEPVPTPVRLGVGAAPQRARLVISFSF